MHFVSAVSLSVPCLFHNRRSNRMASDFFVFQHRRFHKRKVLFRKRFHTIIFRAAVRILPQFNVKCVRKCVCIRQNYVRHVYGISKGKRFFYSICRSRQRSRIHSGRRVFRYVKFHPYRLYAVPAYIYGSALLIENIRTFASVRACRLRQRPGFITITPVCSVISFDGFDKRRLYMIR